MTCGPFLSRVLSGRSPDIRCCVKSLPRRPENRAQRMGASLLPKFWAFLWSASEVEMPESLDANYAREIAETIYHPGQGSQKSEEE